MADNTPSCPFCPFSDQDPTFVEQHIEYCHPEGGPAPPSPPTSSFKKITPQPSSPSPSHPLAVDDETSTEKYLDCPHGCGETITATELPTHLDLHIAEGIALDDCGPFQTSSLNTDDLSSDPNPEDLDDSYMDSESKDFHLTQKGGKRGADRDFTRSNNTSKQAPRRNHSPVGKIGPDGAKRLGRSELGPHAHEKRMPTWLKKMLEKGSSTTKQTRITPDGRLSRHTKVENETDHLIPVIAKLCEQDSSSQRVFLCSDQVRHICKMSREGGFCGYRNIQMLVSYITKNQSKSGDGGGEFGSECKKYFADGVPSILKLQDLIERAWDLGFNSSGRTETGGIKGTRKFIGTPEAQALFMSLGIPCDASSLSDAGNMRAYDALYMDVASYYRSNCSLEDEKKVFLTDLPPIYFQHQGHSMTIIGFEIRDNGSANLLVFDPMFKTSPAMTRLIGSISARSDNPSRLLKAYRRETKYLQKYKMFELLKLRVSRPVHS